MANPNVTSVIDRSILLVTTSLSFILAGCIPPAPENNYVEPPPPTVDVAKPIQQKILVFLEETGQTEAKETAEVRARVTGILEAIKFTPGQKVTAPVEMEQEKTTSEGDREGILYTIEKDTYQATVVSAEATVGTAEAAIKTAEAQVLTAQAQVEVASVQVKLTEDEFKRISSLLEKGVVNQSDYDKAKAERDAAVATEKSAISSVKAAETSVDAAKAELESAKAKLAQAELDLGYTDVEVPIDGMVTKTEVKLGNLVENGTLLATVVDIDEVYANFSISDTDALKLKQTRRDEEEAEADSVEPSYLGWPAYLKREIDPDYIFKGEIDYVDAKGVDVETGTLQIRAVFDNADNRLTPGLFVYIRVPFTEEPQDALLLPEKDINRDQVSAYVLVVNDKNEVERKNVRIGQDFEGHVVITEGLEADDLVIVSGKQRLREGVKVQYEEGNIKTLKTVSIPGIDSPVSESDDTTAKESSKVEADAKSSDTTPTDN